MARHEVYLGTTEFPVNKSGCWITVYRDGKHFGYLEIGTGGIAWKRGKRTKKVTDLSWQELATVMEGKVKK